eukprot:TRINITY_DN2962_c0_g1_i1.p1 TRINITY_DN2962_c0_g1~~TRINITY_DN2962_c0_g1_i1.p1  ORF type:complete len:368 (+),score=53.73 TRINITY_DN2962_c0_g1_i1:25-1128(+)
MGNMGGVCMRDCSRPDAEDPDQPMVKLMPLLCPSASPGKMSIERVSTDRHEGHASSDSTMELPVPTGAQRVFFPAVSMRQDPEASSSSTPMKQVDAAFTTPQRGVPPVSNWFQVYQRGTASDQPKESPRFEEVLTGVTPSPRGGEFRTPRTAPDPRATPRESPRPLESPRPPDEGGKEITEELLYEGTYLGTMKHGTGRLRMQNYTYEGEFENDMKHGVGVLDWDDGRRFEGGFKYGKFHGAAVMIWPDGRKYVGQYEDDRKHGEGTFSWQDGRRYQGQWVAGKRHGVGTYTNAKGFTRRGTWQQDRPVQWDEPTNSQSSPGPAASLVTSGSPMNTPSKPVLAPEHTSEINTPQPEQQEDEIYVSNL